MRELRAGKIVAIRGLGGFHLACDATNADGRANAAHSQAALRQALRADGARRGRDPPLRDAYRSSELALLQSPAAPIVLLNADRAERLPEDVAPGLEDAGLHAALYAAASC